MYFFVKKLMVYKNKKIIIICVTNDYEKKINKQMEWTMNLYSHVAVVLLLMCSAL